MVLTPTRAARRWVARFAILLVLPVTLQADTLYLRDGTRIQGDLIAIRNGQIEFEERRGFGAARTMRIDRDDVARIEFENRAYGNNNNNSGNDLVWQPSIRDARAPDDCFCGHRLE